MMKKKMLCEKNNKKLIKLLNITENDPLLYNGVLDGIEIKQNKDDQMDLKSIYLLINKLFDYFIEQFNLIMKPNKLSTILDIGCSSGAFAKKVNYKLIGIDVSEYLVNIFNKINNKHMAFIIDDTTNLFFPNKSFDYVIVSSVFQYFNNLDYSTKVIEECKRIAKRGIFIFMIYRTSKNSKHLCYTEKFFTDLGFTINNSDFYKEYNQNYFDAYLQI
jgi:ubiquinone/menaquinone biosynthesis C-methylase UbiE